MRGRRIKPDDMRRRVALGMGALAHIERVVEELMNPHPVVNDRRRGELSAAADAQLKLLNKALPDLKQVEASAPAQAARYFAPRQGLEERHKLALATKLLQVLRGARWHSSDGRPSK